MSDVDEISLALCSPVDCKSMIWRVVGTIERTKFLGGRSHLQAISSGNCFQMNYSGE